MVPTLLLMTPSTHGITLIANLVRPELRGRMSLRSADTKAPPLIEPNYFSDARDLQILVDGIRYVRTIVNAAPMCRLVEETLGPDPNLQSDADLGAYCKSAATTNFHPVGGCRMSLDSDPFAVLTPQLAVRGVRGLWVLDASMTPSIISANTNAAVMAVADRAVELMMIGAT